MPTSDESEKEVHLLKLAKAGRESIHLLAYADAFDTYRMGIYRLLSRMLQDQEEAKDMLQEVFFMGWRDLSQLVNGASFRAWLFRIATNKALEALRRRNRFWMVRVEDEEVLEFLEAMQVPGPEEQVLTKVMVEQALAKVTPSYRACILLREDGHSQAEIATILGCSKGSISKMLIRATEQFIEAYTRLEEQIRLDLERES